MVYRMEVKDKSLLHVPCSTKSGNVRIVGYPELTSEFGVFPLLGQAVAPGFQTLLGLPTRSSLEITTTESVDTRALFPHSSLFFSNTWS
jgi:hypothetical protein